MNPQISYGSTARAGSDHHHAPSIARSIHSLCKGGSNPEANYQVCPVVYRAALIDAILENTKRMPTVAFMNRKANHMAMGALD